MNLLEHRTEIRRVMLDTDGSAPAFTDADLNKYINEGLKDACLRGDPPVLEQTQTVAVTTTVATYSMKWDFIKMLIVKNPSGITLDQMTEDDAGKVFTVTGKSTAFYLTNVAITIAVRANNTLYAQGLLLTPTAGANGFMYEVTTGGTTGGSAPSYSTNSGSSVADGTAVLTCRELMSKVKQLVLIETPTTAGGGTGNYTIRYKAMDEGIYVDTDAPNIPLEKHYGLVDFGCARILASRRQYLDALVFYNKYATVFGIDPQTMPYWMPGGGQSAQ